MIKFCGNSSNFSKFENVSPQYIIDTLSVYPSIEVDTETTGLDVHSAKLLTLQLGAGGHEFVIDCRVVNVLLFKELIENKLCLLHNAKYDYKILLHAGIMLNKIYDTMLAEVVIFNGYDRRYSLSALCKNYLQIDLPKDERAGFSKVRDEALTDQQIEYAGNDVKYLHHIAKIQKNYINHFDLQYSIDLECQVVKAFADIEYNGMYLDSKEWLLLAQENKKKLYDLTFRMDDYLIDKGLVRPTGLMNLFGEKERQTEINYASSKQMLYFLRTLGYDIKDTNNNTIVKLSGEFVDMLKEYRKLAKSISTYGESFLDNINPITRRVHTDFWQIKHTFRVSSNNPNIQNIPSINEYRNCFKARKGYSLASTDYSGMEMKIMADFSKEKGFLIPISEGKDIHNYVASEVFGRTITKEDKQERTKIKIVNFMKPFGGGPPKLSAMMNIPIEESEELFKIYDGKFVRLDKYLKKQAKFAVDNGYILTNGIHKGRRWFPECKLKDTDNWYKLKGSVERQAMNLSIQSTGAVQIKDSMVHIREYLIENNLHNKDVYMITNIHDEIGFEIRDELVEELVPVFENIMRTTANKYVSSVDMTVESTIDKMWKK